MRAWACGESTEDHVHLTSKIDVGDIPPLPQSGTGGLPCGSPAVRCQSAWRPLYRCWPGAYDKAVATLSRETTPRNLTSSSRPSMLPIVRVHDVVPPRRGPFRNVRNTLRRGHLLSVRGTLLGRRVGHYQATRVGRRLPVCSRARTVARRMLRSGERFGSYRPIADVHSTAFHEAGWVKGLRFS